MWAVLGRDGQLMSEQETPLYLEVKMMMKNETVTAGRRKLHIEGIKYILNKSKLSWQPNEGEQDGRDGLA
jgi:hypothetical protein